MCHKNKHCHFHVWYFKVFSALCYSVIQPSGKVSLSTSIIMVPYDNKNKRCRLMIPWIVFYISFSCQSKPASINVICVMINFFINTSGGHLVLSISSIIIDIPVAFIYFKYVIQTQWWAIDQFSTSFPCQCHGDRREIMHTVIGIMGFAPIDYTHNTSWLFNQPLANNGIVTWPTRSR